MRSLITNQILEMWQQFAAQLSSTLTMWYESMTEPVALLMGVPITLCLIALIFRRIGGKFR